MTFCNDDCISEMNKMQPESVDAVITDPPFGIDFKAKRSNNR